MGLFVLQWCLYICFFRGFGVQKVPLFNSDYYVPDLKRLIFLYWYRYRVTLPKNMNVIV